MSCEVLVNTKKLAADALTRVPALPASSTSSELCAPDLDQAVPARQRAVANAQGHTADHGGRRRGSLPSRVTVNGRRAAAAAYADKRNGLTDCVPKGSCPQTRAANPSQVRKTAPKWGLLPSNGGC